MTEIEGRLPIFSGFYGTVFDPDYALDVIECDERRKQATDLIMESNPEFDLDAALLGLLEATRERKQEHHED